MYPSTLQRVQVRDGGEQSESLEGRKDLRWEQDLESFIARVGRDTFDRLSWTNRPGVLLAVGRCPGHPTHTIAHRHGLGVNRALGNRGRRGQTHDARLRRLALSRIGNRLVAIVQSRGLGAFPDHDNIQHVVPLWSG